MKVAPSGATCPWMSLVHTRCNRTRGAVAADPAPARPTARSRATPAARTRVPARSVAAPFTLPRFETRTVATPRSVHAAGAHRRRRARVHRLQRVLHAPERLRALHGHRLRRELEPHLV